MSEAPKQAARPRVGGLVRPARPGDAAALTRILRASAACRSAPLDTEMVRARLERATRGAQSVFVAETPQGRAAGFVSVAWGVSLSAGHEGYLADLVVHPRWRGRGLGSRLLAAVLEEARRRGCCRLHAPSLGPASPPCGFLTAQGWQGRGAQVLTPQRAEGERETLENTIKVGGRNLKPSAEPSS